MDCQFSHATLQICLPNSLNLKLCLLRICIKNKKKENGWGIGAVLFQKNTENLEHPIAYTSCLLSSPEQNYTVLKRECFVAIWAVRYFKHYLHSPKFDLYG